jgi:pyridinium-3,5-biscarboxylic acid mononucleotide sulfurtransferase
MDKLERLKEYISKLDKVIIAFSGGVDSTFLLKVAYDLLGENVFAVTVNSDIRKNKSLQLAKDIAANIGVEHHIIEIDELQDPDFINNGSDRCYYCKKILYLNLKDFADRYDIKYILDGTNYEEVLNENRPGFKALMEMDIKIPLYDLKFNKEEIRSYARELGLSNKDIYSDTCLATRIACGIKLNKNLLKKIEVVEDYLQDIDIMELRARYHGDNLIRIEVNPEDFNKVITNREGLILKCREMGFEYITLDLMGFKNRRKLDE